MSSSLGVSVQTVNADVVARDLHGAAARSSVELSRAVSRAGLEGGRELRLIMSAPSQHDPFWGKTGSGGPGLSVRSGKTRGAIVATGRVYTGAYGELYTIVGHASNHVRDLEDGATVHGNPWVKIPTAQAQTPAGVDRFLGRRVPGGFVWPTKRMKNFANGRPKNLWIAAVRDGALRLFYMLRGSVKLKAHHSFGIMRARLEPRVRLYLAEATARLVKI